MFRRSTTCYGFTLAIQSTSTVYLDISDSPNLTDFYWVVLTVQTFVTRFSSTSSLNYSTNSILKNYIFSTLWATLIHFLWSEAHVFISHPMTTLIYNLSKEMHTLLVSHTKNPFFCFKNFYIILQTISELSKIRKAGFFSVDSFV